MAKKATARTDEEEYGRFISSSAHKALLIAMRRLDHLEPARRPHDPRSFLRDAARQHALAVELGKANTATVCAHLDTIIATWIPRVHLPET